MAVSERRSASLDAEPPNPGVRGPTATAATTSLRATAWPEAIPAARSLAASVGDRAKATASFSCPGAAACARESEDGESP